MMFQTIVQYIRGTDIPYPDIIKRAIRGGWKATKDKADTDTRTVILEKSGNTSVTICYYLDNPKLACYTNLG